MKVIEAFARILSDEGADAVGVTVNLEVYVLSSRRWVRLASAKSAAKGIWQAKATRLRSGAFYAPMLRLTEAGNPAPRVLAQSGKLSYNATSQVLSVDFGQVERLAETAYPLSASNSRFSRIQHTVAGQAKRAEVSSATLMRNIALASNINLSRTTAASTGNATVATGNTTLLDTYNAEVLKLRSNEAKLQSQLSQKDQLLATRQQDLSKASSRIAELESTLAKSLANEAKLKEENASFSATASHKAPIQDIAANIGAEVDAANRRLRDAQHGYRFGKIELDLRGSVSDDGQSMALASLVDLSRLSAGVALPGVKLELLPKRERPITSDNVKVPDVSGLTETAVRRLLQAAGLRLEPVSKSLGPKPKIPVGQAIQQSPKAGAEIARGERVLVVFATP